MKLDQGRFTRLNHNGQYSQPHNYFINNNIDLRDINNLEKKIYNPSEVSITADNLIFPANYTFLTARGTYAYKDEYEVQTSDLKNDFAFFNNEERDFPIVTDLRYEGSNTSYPPNDPSYASIYKLESGSKLTIEPCVHIYDCTFDVKPGSEIVFENELTNQYNVNRYNVLENGGTITRRRNEYFLQKEQISSRILNFESGTLIKAGNNVSPGNQTGDYEILMGGEVNFKASQEIILEEGFTVEDGAQFTASIDNVLIPSCPPMRRVKPGHERKEFAMTDLPTIKFLQASPNPTSGEINFYFGTNSSEQIRFQIFNVYGQLIHSVSPSVNLKSGDYSFTFQTGSLESGVYIGQISSGNDLRSVKFVKN